MNILNNNYIISILFPIFDMKVFAKQCRHEFIEIYESSCQYCQLGTIIPRIVRCSITQRNGGHHLIFKGCIRDMSRCRHFILDF